MMKKTTSYTEFRKKNPNKKDVAMKDKASISEIDQLSKQLEVLAGRKTSLAIGEKYKGSNGVIFEVEEDESPRNKNIKKCDSDTFKLHMVQKKKTMYEIPVPNKKSNHLNSNANSSKVNKSMDTSVNARKNDTLLNERNGKQKVERNSYNPKTANRPMQMAKYKEEKRMSLKQGEHHHSLLSTSSSINREKGQLGGQQSQKQEIYGKIAKISTRIEKKGLPMHFLEEIEKRLMDIDRILDQC